MGYIENNLDPGERITLQAKLSKAMFIVPVLVILLFAVPGFYIFTGSLPHSGVNPLVCIALLFLLLGAIGIVSLIDDIVSYTTTRFALTDQRILAKTGLLRRRSLEMSLTEVERIQVTQSDLGRIFDYGMLVVVGKDGLREAFPFIADPMDFSKRISEQTSKKA